MINYIIFDIYFSDERGNMNNIRMNFFLLYFYIGKFKIDKTIYTYCKFFYKGMRRYFRSLRILIVFLP